MNETLEMFTDRQGALIPKDFGIPRAASRGRCAPRPMAGQGDSANFLNGNGIPTRKGASDAASGGVPGPTRLESHNGVKIETQTAKKLTRPSFPVTPVGGHILSAPVRDRTVKLATLPGVEEQFQAYSEAANEPRTVLRPMPLLANSTN